MKRLDATLRRSAFTLVELLVVIAIIAILASLLLAGVMKALSVVKDVQNRNDISQLAAAVSSFKQTFGVDYMPSSFNPAGASDQFYMTRLFPQVPAGYAWPGPLEGEECLVFFLGGLQQGGQCYGFSSNPRDPLAAPTAGEIRKGPFFDFKANRLMPVAGHTFPSYLDVYGFKPYAYFSTYGTTNSYQATDCASLGVAPYLQSAGAYLKPDSFQIISAGKDMQFGPGGVVWPGVTGGPGADDIANFSAARLSAGQ
jgi:prepilin-type N-terminal cleavage/methylation domain-containing protein